MRKFSVLFLMLTLAAACAPTRPIMSIMNEQEVREWCASVKRKAEACSRPMRSTNMCVSSTLAFRRRLHRLK
ncbi:MAG: hypothetical protein WDM79_11090 [Terricaulis sp.]